MREVLSLSLPGDVITKIKKTAKERGFNSVSKYLRTLFTEDVKDIISEKELVAIIEEGRKEYREGKLIEADSLADFL
jgi:hypothetical protein